MLLVSFIWSIYIIVRLYYDGFHSWDFWLCPFVDVSETLQLSHKWVQDGPISKTFQLTLALCGDCRRSGITWNSVCWSQLCSSSPWQACIWPTKITGLIRKLALLRWLWWLWCNRKYIISNRASRASSQRIKNCIRNPGILWHMMFVDHSWNLEPMTRQSSILWQNQPLHGYLFITHLVCRLSFDLMPRSDFFTDWHCDILVPLVTGCMTQGCSPDLIDLTYHSIGHRGRWVKWVWGIIG